MTLTKLLDLQGEQFRTDRATKFKDSGGFRFQKFKGPLRFGGFSIPSLKIRELFDS